MEQIKRIEQAMNLEPDRYKRMSMNSVLRDTLQKMERLKGESA